MKSAYELAMERLSKGAPAKSLTAGQKAELAELESLYKSRLAQLDLRTQDALATAEAAGDDEQVARIRSQFLKEKGQLQSDWDAKRDAIRDR